MSPSHSRLKTGAPPRGAGANGALGAVICLSHSRLKTGELPLGGTASKTPRGLS
jgi:hypothetical protein